MTIHVDSVRPYDYSQSVWLVTFRKGAEQYETAFVWRGVNIDAQTLQNAAEAAIRARLHTTESWEFEL
jgi:hypothetical protein